MKVLAYAVAGPERRRIVYRGPPGTEKYEEPNHNPFAGLEEDDPDIVLVESGGALLLETGDRILLEAA